MLRRMTAAALLERVRDPLPTPVGRGGTAGFDTIYGPLGAAPAFLALVYVAAALVLLGAELIFIRTR
jgi:hypothetical protein